MSESTTIGQEKERKEGEDSLGRFTDMVYASALRQMKKGGGDPYGAADVTQAVFIVAMEKQRAGKLPGDQRLAGWLLKVTGFCVKKAKRAAMRRSFHEQRAAETRSETMRQESSTNEVAQVLDEALLKLGEIDREVVVRRYLHGETVGSVAAAVRLTEGAAQMRIGRALEKLRKILARRGVVAPAAALTGVMLAESAKAAPAALAVAGVTAGSNAAAMSIAKGAAMAMKLAAIKTVAVCVVVAVAIGVAVVFAVAQQPATSKVAVTATAPTANKEAKVPGITQLARWGVLLNEAGAAEVRKVGVPFVSKSKVYEGMTANSAVLRAAVRDAMNNGGAVRTSRDLDFAYDWGAARKLKFTINDYWYDYDDKSTVNLMGSGGSNGDDWRNDFERVGTDRMRVTVNYPDLKIGVNEVIRRGKYSGPGEQAIVFSDEMGAGEATAFLGKYVGPSGKVYYHLIVWEVFKAQAEQMAVGFNQNDSGWWCVNGPETLRKWADAARAWTAQAGHESSQVAAGFEKKLEDGKVVRLVALCRPSQWPGCWWDAQGNPVAGANGMIMMQGDPPKGLWALVDVEAADGVKERGLLSPLGWPKAIPIEVRSLPGKWGDSQCEKVEDEGRAGGLEVGVMVGPWKLVGSLYEGQSITEGGVEYRVSDARSLSNGDDKAFLVTFWRKGMLADNQDYLVPATVDGKTVETHLRLSTILFGPKPGVQTVKEYPNYHDLLVKDVKEFRIYQRKREWVSFEGFAREPKVKPATEVSAMAVAQAEDVAKRRADEKRLAELEAKRAAWRAVPADAKTEMGALRVLIVAMQKGDEKGVAAMMMSEKPKIAGQMGAMAHGLVVMEQVRAMAVERYGELAVQDKLMGSVAQDSEREFMGKWTRAADGVLTQEGTGISLRKRADGTYALNWDNMEMGEEAFVGQVQAMTAWMEKAKRLMEANPKMTAEELKAAMEKERAAER